MNIGCLPLQIFPCVTDPKHTSLGLSGLPTWDSTRRSEWLRIRCWQKLLDDKIDPRDDRCGVGCWCNARSLVPMWLKLEENRYLPTRTNDQGSKVPEAPETKVETARDGGTF